MKMENPAIGHRDGEVRSRASTSPSEGPAAKASSSARSPMPTDAAMTSSSRANQRYFEDYRVGEVHYYGRIEMTVEDIVDFGRRVDPQKMHTDVQRWRGCSR